MVHPTRPGHCDNGDFVTEFEPVDGPGFFPGASGYFHGCASTCSSRIVLFGTEFGLEKDWRKDVVANGGERRTQATLCALRCLIDEVADDTGISDLACWCRLSNAVLALAKHTERVQKPTDAHKAYDSPDAKCYLRECGDTHRRWLQEQKPDLVVLLGARQLSDYRRDIWSRVWCDLFGPGGEWHRIEMKDALDDPVRSTESGPRVQLMYHPSSGRHWHNHLDRARRVLVEEVKKLARSSGR